MTVVAPGGATVAAAGDTAVTCLDVAGGAGAAEAAAGRAAFAADSGAAFDDGRML